MVDVVWLRHVVGHLGEDDNVVYLLRLNWDFEYGCNIGTQRESGALVLQLLQLRFLYETDGAVTPELKARRRP